MSMWHRLYKDWRKYTTGAEHALEVVLFVNVLSHIIRFSSDHDSLRLYIILMYSLLILFMALMRISDGKHRDLCDELESWFAVLGKLHHQDTAYVKVFEDDGKLYMGTVKK